MDVFERITGWFQIGASALFMLFSLFNLARSFVQHPETFYFLCFAVMLCISWKLLRLSIKELHGTIKKGGKR